MNNTENIIKQKFNVIKTLEEWRWEQNIKKYNFEISFFYFNKDCNKFFNKKNNKFKIYKKNLAFAEQILLTHYLLYICDRQMDYRHIFKAGGYVVSHLVKEYLSQREKNKSFDDYNWNKIFKICRMYKEYKNGEKQYSYFLCAPIKDKSTPNEKDEIYYYFKKRGRIINSGSLKEEVKNKGKNKENEAHELIYHIYGFKIKDKEEYALFSSRNMLQDIGCMYKTLSYLNKNAHEKEKFEDSEQKQIEKSKRIIKSDGYNGSFTEFLREHSNDIYEYDDKSKKINKETTGLARALYELTYQRIPQISAPSETILDFDTFFEYITDQISGAFKKEKKNVNDYPLQHNRHSLKRMWCVIRDFLVNPVFKACFKCIIGNGAFNELEKKYYKIELPGDVWNNNLRFCQCFWEKYVLMYEKDNEKLVKTDANGTKTILWENFKSSGFVRERYDNATENKTVWSGCLPIDFDITFNFVPRMCEEDKCHICPLNPENIDWQKQICQKTNGKKLCPLALYACGIEYPCKKGCALSKQPD